MNKKQLICMWVGIVIVVLMLLYPPTFVQTPGKNEQQLRYNLIIFKNSNTSEYHPDRIDIVRLLIQVCCMAIITGGLICTFKNKK